MSNNPNKTISKYIRERESFYERSFTYSENRNYRLSKEKFCVCGKHILKFYHKLCNDCHKKKIKKKESLST